MGQQSSIQPQQQAAWSTSFICTKSALIVTVLQAQKIIVQKYLTKTKNDNIIKRKKKQSVFFLKS